MCDILSFFSEENGSNFTDGQKSLKKQNMRGKSRNSNIILYFLNLYIAELLLFFLIHLAALSRGSKAQVV